MRGRVNGVNVEVGEESPTARGSKPSTSRRYIDSRRQSINLFEEGAGGGGMDGRDEMLKSLHDLGRALIESGGLDSDDDDDTVLSPPLVQLSVKDAAASSMVASPRLDDQAFRAMLWDTTPVEKEIFKNFTRRFGFLFNSWRMERIFLDGHARLHKNVVYLGYALLLFDAIVALLLTAFRPYLMDRVCAEEMQYCKVLLQSQLYRGFWKDIISYYAKFVFAYLLPLIFIGCCLNFFVHRINRIKEKSWALLIVFVLYSVLQVALLAANIVQSPLTWPDALSGVLLAMFSVFFFFSGTPSCTVFFLLFLVYLIIVMIAYFGYSIGSLQEKTGKDVSIEFLYLEMQFRNQTFTTAAFLVLYLVGSYLQDLAYRKQFLQRIIMHTQQKQIIREKTKNENLQRKLLENMLPKSIVDQLQQQNFTINSWDELRALSHRHLGVSILFAELEHFTTFSSEVDPPRVMAYLNDLFLIFDNLCDQYEVYKVETVGDQYVAAVGVVTGDMLTEEAFSMRGMNPSVSGKTLGAVDDQTTFSEASIRDVCCSNTESMIGFGQAIIEGSRHVVIPETSARPLLRVGIHTGPCMSGIVGTRNFRFCLFGDTMNTAARMEQHGVPECIHVSQDVVDLAPEHSWEKREKLNMKGKGSMQTYLLHVACDLADETGACNGAGSDYKHGFGTTHRMPALGEEESEANQDESEDDDLDSAFDMLSPMTNVGSDGSVYQDVLPVKEKVFKRHTKWFGLFFRRMQIERAFLDSHARLYKNVVFLGYGLYVFELLCNFLYGYIALIEQRRICSSPEYDRNSVFYQGCLPVFVKESAIVGTLSNDTNVDDVTVTYSLIMESAYIRIPPAIACVLAASITYGIASHWYIHRSERFKEKSWALLNVWMVYVLNLVVVDLTIILLRLPDNAYQQWPSGFYFHNIIQSTLLVICTGTPFTLNLLWWILAAALQYGLSIPVLIGNQKLIQDELELIPILTDISFYNYSGILFWYSIVLWIGSYFKDISWRKSFLQRILLLKQQTQIIRAKTKKERTQRGFLETILPPSLVGELQSQQEDKTNKASFKRLKSLTKTHVGVSMLFADLVGFTAFSAQVDPFKVMVFLNDLFHVFDNMCDEYNVYKLETVGDCYVATVGVVTGELVSMAMDSCTNTLTDSMEEEISASNSKDLVGFAKAMIRASRGILKPEVDTPATMRIGIHVGPCMSGIIGTKKFKFCLLGDTVVKAAHMEKWGTPDCIHCSQEIVDLVPEEGWEKCKVLHDSELLYHEQTYLLHV